jgi:hypothetical protein
MTDVPNQEWWQLGGAIPALIGGAGTIVVSAMTFVAGRALAKVQVKKTFAEIQEIKARVAKTEAERKALIDAGDDPEERLHKKLMSGFEQLADSYAANLKSLQDTIHGQGAELKAQGEALAKLREDNHSLAKNVQILTEENRGLVREVADLQVHIDMLVTAMRAEETTMPISVPKRLVDNAKLILAGAGDSIPTKAECVTCRYNESCQKEPALQVLRIAGRLCRPTNRREDAAVIVNDMTELGDVQV